MSSEDAKAADSEAKPKKPADIVVPGKYHIRLRPILSGRRRAGDDQAIVDATSDGQDAGPA
jgi:hypothetical protein